jgi:hypothetical protein
MEPDLPIRIGGPHDIVVQPVMMIDDLLGTPPTPVPGVVSISVPEPDPEKALAIARMVMGR